jgi:trimethylamine---corrinoid protein Co-methyltransferase
MPDDMMWTLHEATLAVLERTGVRVDSDSALALLSDRGIRVDWSTRRVHPSQADVERALALTPRSLLIYGRDITDPVRLEGDNAYIMSGGSSLRVLTLDDTLVPATWEHLRQFNTLLDALPHIHVCINQVDPQDDEGEGMYRRLAAEMLAGQPKPCLLQASSAADIRAMAEMGRVLRGSREALIEKPVFIIGCNSEPPLYIPRHIAELTIAACEEGLPISVGNYHMLGITAPRTVAGGVVQLNAVQLASLVLVQAVRPGTPIPYTAFSGSGNMRTLDPITSDGLSLRQLRLAAELGRWYGLPVYGVAVTDSKLPDAQASHEHTLQLEMDLEAGVHLIQGFTSMMDQMMLSSFAQAVIDNDIAGCVLAARKRPELSAETLALDVIHDVATDPTLTDLKYAAHPHTVRHLHDEPWRPATFTYASFMGWRAAGSPTVLDRAKAVARDILAHHEVRPLAPEAEKDIRRIAQAS